MSSSFINYSTINNEHCVGGHVCLVQEQTKHVLPITITKYGEN